MNPFGELGRRAFLALAAAAAGCGVPLRAGRAQVPQSESAAGLALVFKHRQSAIAIGRRYLSHYPDDALPHALAQAVLRGEGGTPAAARDALRARVREDFERGDTVLLEGWVLARSECQACAAIALAAGAAVPAAGS
jgi:hypothetical protein